MNRSATLKMRHIAHWLVAHEAKENKSSGTNVPGAFGVVLAKLRGPVAALTGVAGFRSLLARALALASDEVRWFRAVHIKADGSLECPAAMAQLDRKELAKAETVLVAELLGLLGTFIGEGLNLSLLQEVWPEAPLKHFDDRSKDSKEDET